MIPTRPRNYCMCKTEIKNWGSSNVRGKVGPYSRQWERRVQGSKQLPKVLQKAPARPVSGHRIPRRPTVPRPIQEGVYHYPSRVKIWIATSPVRWPMCEMTSRGEVSVSRENFHKATTTHFGTPPPGTSCLDHPSPPSWVPWRFGILVGISSVSR